MAVRRFMARGWPVTSLVAFSSLLGCGAEGDHGPTTGAVVSSAGQAGGPSSGLGGGPTLPMPTAGATPTHGGQYGAAGASSAGSQASGGTSSMGGRSMADGDRPATRPCSGRSGALHGKSSQTVNVGGLPRTFVHYAPLNLNANEPVPAVIVAHGWLQSGQAMYDLAQYQKVADREGFILLYPDGEPASVGPWNVGEGACPSTLLVLPTATGDDQAFVDAMIEFADTDQCVDRRHVFLTGFSMGGYFANETGCLRSSIAAIGPHSGGSHDLSACPVVHKPVILFHGLSDGLIPAACGTEARARWVAHNGCSGEVDSVAVTGGHCEYSKGCPADGQVALCLFDGMDHGWAGGQGSYGFPDYESASELGWAFFKKYGW